MKYVLSRKQIENIIKEGKFNAEDFKFDRLLIGWSVNSAIAVANSVEYLFREGRLDASTINFKEFNSDMKELKNGNLSIRIDEIEQEIIECIENNSEVQYDEEEDDDYSKVGELKRPSDTTKQLQETIENFKGYDFELTEEQLKDLRNGLISFFIVTECSNSKGANFSYEFMKQYALNASANELLDDITDIRRRAGEATDGVEDFIADFEVEGNHSLDYIKNIANMIKKEIGKDVNITFIENMIKTNMKDYKCGKISRRECGNIMLWNTLLELTNPTLMSIFFYGKI